MQTRWIEPDQTTPLRTKGQDLPTAVADLDGLYVVGGHGDLAVACVPDLANCMQAVGPQLCAARAERDLFAIRSGRPDDLLVRPPLRPSGLELVGGLDRAGCRLERQQRRQKKGDR